MWVLYYADIVEAYQTKRHTAFLVGYTNTMRSHESLWMVPGTIAPEEL